MKVILCSCVAEQDDEAPAMEEKQLLLPASNDIVAEKVAKLKDAPKLSKELNKVVSSGLDIFKGILAFLMIYSHVDLCLVNPTEVYYTQLGHFVGNAASGMCFLGFVFSYGYTCYCAYLSDWNPRPWAQRMERVVRSAILPIIGAWICSFAWSFMCFKNPINGQSFVDILTFYYVWGNGPDFLLSFTTMLLVSFALRTPLNMLLGDPKTRGYGRLVLATFVLLTAPMLLTQWVVDDCTVNRRYYQFLFLCDKREPIGMANLPALPHFFYFNLGVLAAVGIKAAGEKLDASAAELPGLTRRAREMLPAVVTSVCIVAAVASVLLAVMAYPLYDNWWLNFGNMMTESKWGPIIRGWSRGPSPLWLLGNLWWIYMLLVGCMVYALVAHMSSGPALKSVATHIEHFGANVLIYLVCSDCFLAGLYRPGAFPINVHQAGFATVVIMYCIRFIHYLGHSGRK